MQTFAVDTWHCIDRHLGVRNKLYPKQQSTMMRRLLFITPHEYFGTCVAHTNTHTHTLDVIPKSNSFKRKKPRIFFSFILVNVQKLFLFIFSALLTIWLDTYARSVRFFHYSFGFHFKIVRHFILWFLYWWTALIK